MKTPTLMLTAAAFGLTACNAMGSPPPPPLGGPGGNATLTTATKAPFGTYVVDGSGRAVYILEGTRGMSGINRCSGACLSAWPPMMINGRPGGASGISQAQLRTVSGYSGTQVSYSGWPLYYYHTDQAPGDTTGQGVRDQWGMWYLIRPNGEPIRPAGGY